MRGSNEAIIFFNSLRFNKRENFIVFHSLRSRDQREMEIKKEVSGCEFMSHNNLWTAITNLSISLSRSFLVTIFYCLGQPQASRASNVRKRNNQWNMGERGGLVTHWVICLLLLMNRTRKLSTVSRTSKLNISLECRTMTRKGLLNENSRSTKEK